MPKDYNSKHRLIYVLKLLLTKSDEEHPLSASYMREQLRVLGIECDRKSIYSDIDTLTKVGFDVIKTRSGSFIAQRDFELPEVRLLVDAVQAATFITPKKTQQLLEKLGTLTSSYLFEKIRQQVFMEKLQKCKNEQIYYIIDFLNSAIISGKKVVVRYVRKSLDKVNGVTQNEREFIISPYAMLWFNDHYYLVGNNEKYDNLMHMRLDRMKDVAVLDENARHFSEVSDYTRVFDTADYSKKQFNMFSGSLQNVELLCDFTMLEDINDRFGDDACITIVDDEHFAAKIQAAISEGLVSWIMQYGSRITINAPKELKDMYLEKIDLILKNYGRP